jgi:hypothetical protein
MTVETGEIDGTGILCRACMCNECRTADTDDICRCCRDAYDLGRREERQAAAAYCLDRADQYNTRSPLWVATSDCAEGIAKGEAAESLRSGETEDLLARVRTLGGFARPTPKPKTRPSNRTPLTRDKIG